MVTLFSGSFQKADVIGEKPETRVTWRHLSPLFGPRDTYDQGNTMAKGQRSKNEPNHHECAYVKWPRTLTKGESGHVTNTADAQVHGREGLQAAVAGQIAISPRLLSLDAAAVYLSMSPWTIRDQEAQGVLPRVRVPLPRGGELRKLLFDEADLDRLIGAWKDSAA
jgi:hypothetical protein